MSGLLTGQYTNSGTGAKLSTAVQTDASGNLIVTGGGAGALDVNVDQIAGTTTSVNTGAADAGTQRSVTASTSPDVVALQIMDDWDSSDRCKVSPIPGVDGVVGGPGAVSAQTQRVTLGSDDPAVVSLAVLDDWDESDRAKVNLIVGVAGVSAGTGVIDTGTQRVTLATDGVVGQCQNTDDAAIGTKGLSIVAKAKTSQRAAVSDVDAVQIVANEYGELVLSGHTWATRSTRIEEVNPTTAAYLIETVASETDKAAGTYHYYILMNGYKRMGLQFDLTSFSGTDDTIQIYGSMLDTVAGSGVYHDITSQLTGGAATIVASGVIMDDSGITSLFKYLRVTVVITGGGAEDYVITCKKCW